jgi:signal recognition particle subunit SRP54
VQPQEILFVLDAMTGQDAVVTAQSFLDGVGFTGVVLTKLDGDARGGAALSVRELTGRPVMFASTGEKLEDFEIFHPDRMASRILGMGDLLTLIEQAERAFDDDQKSRLADKVATGEDFTLDDFLEQMQAVQKMGSLSKVMSMLPGLGDMREAIDNLDDSDINRIAAIIQSMTPAERKDPSVLNASRRARIAAGSGRTVTDVNQLVDRFTQARKMMKQMAKTGGLGMGGPGMPIPGMGGHGGKKAKPKPAKSKKGRSGNPAKRAAQDAGLDLTEGDSSAANFELPSAFKDLLGGK